MNDITKCLQDAVTAINAAERSINSMKNPEGKLPNAWYDNETGNLFARIEGGSIYSANLKTPWDMFRRASIELKELESAMSMIREIAEKDPSRHIGLVFDELKAIIHKPSTA